MIKILRFTTALIIAPFITSLFILPPLDGYSEWYVGFLKIILIYTYSISLVFGLPVALILAAYKKCTLITLSVSGFILGFTAYLLLLGHQSTATYTQLDIIKSFSAPAWYGVCAAIGASTFGLISGITSGSSATRKTSRALP